MDKSKMILYLNCELFCLWVVWR